MEKLKEKIEKYNLLIKDIEDTFGDELEFIPEICRTYSGYINTRNNLQKELNKHDYY
jgi:hypothetical protein